MLILLQGSISTVAVSQTMGEWTWMKGSNGLNSSGFQGVQGVGSPLVNPGSSYMYVNWQDTTGNFWIYGGHRQNVAYADLWKYNVASNNWAWMKGTGSPGATAVYGTQGIANATNSPGPVRFGAATWTTDDNTLWLYGGYSVAPQPRKGDLWKYDIATNNWTWMKGNQQGGFAGNYGVQGIEASTNLPPGKQFCQAAWVDTAGNLWQFGGELSSGSIDDMWKYNPSTNNWTWMKGSNTCCASPVYGIKGVEDPANTPGARSALMHWTDNQGMFWIFGDESRTSDLWRFNPVTNNWAWMGGAPGTFNSGNYGAQCILDSINLPPGRVFQSTCWNDKNGDFWMFGGQFFGSADKSNDLWKYEVLTGNWVWVSGSNTTGQLGNYGAIGVSSPANAIPSRTGSVGWADKNGNFWIFGGYNHNNDAFNDLWRYTPDTTCGGISTSITQHDDDDIKVYTRGNELIIDSDDMITQEIMISIIDMTGRIVLDISLPVGSRQYSYSLDGINSGVYVIQLNADNTSLTSKKVWVE